jgi:hypothetical protein
VTCRVADFAPVDVGLKTTLTVQLPPTATRVGQLVVRANCPGLVPARPIELIGSTTLPVLLILTTLAAGERTCMLEIVLDLYHDSTFERDRGARLGSACGERDGAQSNEQQNSRQVHGEHRQATMFPARLQKLAHGCFPITGRDCLGRNTLPEMVELLCCQPTNGRRVLRESRL